MSGTEYAVATIEDPSSSVSNDSRGTISNMLAASGPTPCQRVSSVYVYSNGYTGWAEFGWVIGYSNCDGNTYNGPRAFMWVHMAGVGQWCDVLAAAPLAQGQWDTFRTSDTNADTKWDFFLNGTNQLPGGRDLDFAKGWSTAGRERHAADSGRARWHNLSEFHDGNGWSSWDDAEPHFDNDPDYYHQRLDANDVDSTHV